MIKILIVDDNEDITFSIKKMLEKLDKNYSVDRAHSTDEGLEVVKKDEYDIIIIDIMMPGKDGIIFSEQLKQDDKTKNIPIIFLTAKTDEQTKKDVSYSSAGFVAKPVEPMLLDVTIKKALKDTGSIKYLKSVLDE